MKTKIIALLLAAAIGIPATSLASVFVSVRIAPPPLPVYVQPPCPDEGYIWTPGYWAYDYDYDDYYWVPGTWVLAPEAGFFWTPGYWAFIDEIYVWHGGYWGPHVGFYGGVVYGYGYNGYGYDGGRWDHDRFYYNTSVNNVNVYNVHNTYNTTVVNNVNVTRVSYNGGNGGVDARPRREDRRAERDRHIEHTNWQAEHERAARNDRTQFASENHGRPEIAATPKPGAFHDREAVRATAGGDNHWQERQQRGDNGRGDRESRFNRPEAGAQRVQPQPTPEGMPRSENLPRHAGPPIEERTPRGERENRLPRSEPPVMDEHPRLERRQQPRYEERARPQDMESRPTVRGPAREESPRFERVPRERLERQAPQRDERAPRFESPQRPERPEPPMVHEAPPRNEGLPRYEASPQRSWGQRREERMSAPAPRGEQSRNEGHPPPPERGKPHSERDEQQH